MIEEQKQNSIRKDSVQANFQLSLLLQKGKSCLFIDTYRKNSGIERYFGIISYNDKKNEVYQRIGEENIIINATSSSVRESAVFYSKNEAVKTWNRLNNASVTVEEVDVLEQNATEFLPQ
ncbi:MAG: hypothetical protein ACI86H_001860 [bacterium]|jgi:hypothetical protein